LVLCSINKISINCPFLKNPVPLEAAWDFCFPANNQHNDTVLFCIIFTP